MRTTLEPGCDSVMSLSRLASYSVKWTDTLICMSVLHSTHWQKSIFPAVARPFYVYARGLFGRTFATDNPLQRKETKGAMRAGRGAFCVCSPK